MNPAQLLIINRAMQHYQEMVAEALVKNAAGAYIKGAAKGDRVLGFKPAPAAYSRDAEAFGKRYGEDLISRGGSIVYDPKADAMVFKPWLRDSTEETRRSVVDIIEQGIKEGKYPGVKENKRGGYPPGTIAADLEELFDQRRSQATMVARTMTGEIMNTGALERWQRRGINEVKIHDDEGPNSCGRCRELNGKIVSIEWAMEHILEHPNCVRTFSPVIKHIA